MGLNWSIIELNGGVSHVGLRRVGDSPKPDCLHAQAILVKLGIVYLEFTIELITWSWLKLAGCLDDSNLRDITNLLRDLYHSTLLSQWLSKRSDQRCQWLQILGLWRVNSNIHKRSFSHVFSRFHRTHTSTTHELILNPSQVSPHQHPETKELRIRKGRHSVGCICTAELLMGGGALSRLAGKVNLARAQGELSEAPGPKAFPERISASTCKSAKARNCW